jgi:hypothetical protein
VTFKPVLEDTSKTFSVSQALEHKPQKRNEARRRRVGGGGGRRQQTEGEFYLSNVEDLGVVDVVRVATVVRHEVFLCGRDDVRPREEAKIFDLRVPLGPL